MSTMDLHVVTPEREVWTGPATFVSARGIEGDVGILPFHTPMVINLAVSVLGVKTEEGDFNVVVDGGFLHVASKDGVCTVDVLAEHAEMDSEVDVEAAKRLKEDLEGRLATDDSEESKLELEKATARASRTGCSCGRAPIRAAPGRRRRL